MSADLPPDVARSTTIFWRTDASSVASPPILGAAFAIGTLAAMTLRLPVVGAATFVTGVAILAVALATRVRRPTPTELAATLMAVALLSVCLFRSADWLIALCLVGAWAVGTLALVGGRTWTGVLLGALASTLVSLRTARWVRRALVGVRVPGLSSARTWLVVMITAGLLVLFGTLFAAADPAYAALINRAMPSFDGPDIVRRLVTLGLVSAGVLTAAYLGWCPPMVDAMAPPPGRPVRRYEWVVPLALLDLLFLSFVVVQLTVLFGGRGYVLATKGLTYAEYARQGFWQLLIVTVLTLLVVAVAVRSAPRATAAERTLVRLTLGVLCMLALVIVASATHRMSLYEQQYGFTRLRLFVDGVELTLGVVFALLLAAGIRLTSRWLPRAVVGLLSVALLGLAALNPDAYIARHNIARYRQTGRIDVPYLATLSADAVPELVLLPAGVRACALVSIAADLRDSSDPWYDSNLARLLARRLVVNQPDGDCLTG